MSETSEEEDGLKVRESEDLRWECGGFHASRVRGGPEIEPGDMHEVVGAWFALDSRPRRRAGFTRVRVGESPGLIRGHGFHDLEKGLSLGGRHV